MEERNAELVRGEEESDLATRQYRELRAAYDALLEDLQSCTRKLTESTEENMSLRSEVARVLNREYEQKRWAFETNTKAQEARETEKARKEQEQKRWAFEANANAQESIGRPPVALKVHIEANHPHAPSVPQVAVRPVATPDSDAFTIVTGKKGLRGQSEPSTPTPTAPPVAAPTSTPVSAPVQAPFDISFDRVPESDTATIFKKIAWLAVYDMHVYRWAGNEKEWTEFALHLHPDMHPLVSALLSFIARESGCELSIETERLHGSMHKFLRMVRGGSGEPANDCMDKAMAILSRLLISRLDAPHKKQPLTPLPSSPITSPRSHCAVPTPAREGQGRV